MKVKAPCTREHTRSLKWDRNTRRQKFGASTIIPLWLADMDYYSFPLLQKVLHRYVSEGIFGYEIAPQSELDGFISWCKRNYDLAVFRHECSLVAGLIPALSLCLQTFASKGDSTLVMPPVYYYFYEVIERNGLHTCCVDLLPTDATYIINFEAFEDVIVENKIKIFLLCNPHNPVGRVWTTCELLQISSICQRYGVLIISDEIHADLTLFDHSFTSILQTAPFSVALFSPSKAFNVASARVAVMVTKDTTLATTLFHAAAKLSLQHINAFGQRVFETCYSHAGQKWLQSLTSQLEQNYYALRKLFAQHLPLATVYDLEATYLVWIDLGLYVATEDELTSRLTTCAFVGVDYGSLFSPAAATYIRVNIALDTAKLLQAMTQICHAFSP